MGNESGGQDRGFHALADYVIRHCWSEHVFASRGPRGRRIEGSAILTDEQVDYLLLGRTYINIHTIQNKGGKTRGQINLQ